MTEDIGHPIYLGVHQSAAKARRADEPNKPACDPQSLGSTYVLPSINTVEIVASDWWKSGSLSKPS